MIRFGSTAMKLRASVFSRERDFVLETETRAGRARRTTVNGVAVRGMGKNGGVLSTVYFCPEDLLLIRSGPAERRRFMDTALCQLRPRYAEALSRYLSKGTKVALSGKLRYSSWERDGQKRSKLEVIAEEIEFLSRDGDVARTAAPQPAPQYPEVAYEDVPF